MMSIRTKIGRASNVPFTILIFVAFIGGTVLQAYGQTASAATGTPPLGTFTPGPDQINLGNLNSHLPITLFAKPGRGMNFTYVLSFDSTVWQPGLSWTPVPNWGWRGVSEASTGYISRESINENCGLGPQGGATPNVTTEPRFINFQYHDAFGIVHGFSNTAGGCPGDGIENVSTSTDASGYTLDTTTTGQWNIKTPLGLTIFPPVGPNPGAGRIVDRNGNELSNNVTTFTDTLGVTALTVSQAGANPMIYTYTNSSGVQSSVSVNYTSQTVQTHFGCPGIAEFQPQSVNLVSSISLPDGSSYGFTYEATAGGIPGAVTGRIHSITLPTGGTITYNYTGSNNGIECIDGTTAGLDRVTSDGTISYSRSGSGTTWTTTMLDAASPRNTTILNFQTAGSPATFYETHRTVNQGASTVLLQGDACYNGATPPCSNTAINLPITEIKRYLTFNNGQPSLTDTLLNSFGLPTEVDEFDFGATTLLRKTLISYATQTGIAGLPATITVLDGAGVQKAQQTFTYDQGTPSPTTGVPQHVAVSTPRGNLTTSTQWVSTTSSLSTILTYDDTGNVLSRTDPFGNTINLIYADNFSDGINRSTLAYLTQVALPSTGSPAVSHIFKSQFDVNTGLPTKTTDQNNHDTLHTYDALLRPLQTVFADGGQANVIYNSPTSVTQTRLITSSQAASTTSILDALGRVSQQQMTSDPAGTHFCGHHLQFQRSGCLGLQSTSQHSQLDRWYNATQLRRARSRNPPN